MASAGCERIAGRVEAAGEDALAERDYVSPIDVLVGLGWLHPSNVDRWRQGRVDYLERVVFVNLNKVSTAMKALRRWARERGLKPSETEYVARTRDRRRLTFSKSGDAGIERAYRTHWVSAELPERKGRSLTARESRAPDLVVISPLREFTCAECDGGGGLLLKDAERAICMRCADLDHLVFLPSGDAALTRRARKTSGLSAVVVRFSRSRKRYERQGILVEVSALERAEAECLADAEVRARRRERERTRRAGEDVVLQAKMASEIVRLFPGCPEERASAIARHAAARGSGRVGRSAAGRALDPRAIELAVVASVRHVDTDYDELLMSGMSQTEARERVRPEVDRELAVWSRD